MAKPVPMTDYQRMTERAKRISKWWAQTDMVPRLEVPHEYRWHPSPKLGQHAIIAWTPGGFDSRMKNKVADALADQTVSDRDVWRDQHFFSDAFLGSYLGEHRAQALLEMITITPDRTPRALWPSEGRPELKESAHPFPFLIKRNEPVEVGLLDHTMHLPVKCFYWSPRPSCQGSSLCPAVLAATRHEGGTTIEYQRACLVHPEADHGCLAQGVVPAVSDTVVQTPSGPLVKNPLLQFFRLMRNGYVELMNFGTSGESGLLTDFRWATAHLNVLMTHSPEFAEPFMMVSAKGRRLW